MQCLIIIRPKKGLPYKEYAEALVEQAGLNLRLEIRGKIVAGGIFTGEVGGCGIFLVQSIEELNEIIETFPMLAYADIEVHPLISFQRRLDIRLKSFAKLKRKKRRELE